MNKRRWYSVAAQELLKETGAHNPTTAIQQRAKELLDEVGITMPPVNLPIVASFQRVKEIQQIAMSHAGRLIPTGPSYIIQVNAHHSRGKQHFTIGHEIGHTLIPSYQKHPRLIQDISTGTFQQGEEEEYLCDIAAAELLMPTLLFRPRAEASGFHLEAVTELARIFNASCEATARRMVEMELWPCAVAIWHVAYKRREAHRESQLAFDGPEWVMQSPKLRLRYCVANSHFGYYLYPNLAAPEGGCLLYCFTEGGGACAEEHFTLGGQEITLTVMAAAVDYANETGPVREVFSLLLSRGADHATQIKHPALWSLAEE